MSDPASDLHFDPFRLLGVERRFDLDTSQLRRNYLTKVAAVHPDRYADAQDQQEASERSGQINQAYAMLREPESRARVLLDLSNEDAPASDTAALPAELLMEVMEQREQLEAAQASGNTPVIDEVREWAKARLEAGHQSLATAFSEDDPAAATQALTELRYMRRMLDAVSHNASSA